MPHRGLWQSRAGLRREDESWSAHAYRDLEIAIGYLRESTHHRRRSVGYSVAALGALISYSRPFTERPDPAVNQSPAQRRCFLALAADLGADLRLHSKLLQMRAELIALSDTVKGPAAPLNARCFKYPDPHLARIIRHLDQAHFRKLAVSMRVACAFNQVQILARTL
jgi:hypothetical protein